MTLLVSRPWIWRVNSVAAEKRQPTKCKPDRREEGLAAQEASRMLLQFCRVIPAQLLNPGGRRSNINARCRPAHLPNFRAVPRSNQDQAFPKVCLICDKLNPPNKATANMMASADARPR